MYRGADKSLARPGRKQATATKDFEFHIPILIIIEELLVLFIYRVFHDLRTLLREVISKVFVIKKVHINMCPILDGYGVMTALEEKIMIIDNKRNKIINQHNT